MVKYLPIGYFIPFYKLSHWWGEIYLFFFSIMRLFGGRKMKPQFIHMPTSSGYIILDHNGVEMFLKLHLSLQFQMTFYIRGHSTTKYVDQILPNFDHLPTWFCVQLWIFYILSTLCSQDQVWTFYWPPLFVYVVIEWPLTVTSKWIWPYFCEPVD